MVDEKNTVELNNKNADHTDEADDLLELETESKTLEKTLQEVENLKHQIELLEDKLLRTKAESENIRKRYEKMIEDARDYSISNFTKDLLNVMDNLSRALEHKPEELDEQMSSMFSGVDMTKNELTSVFKKYGLESIEPQAGEKFDYNLHHAVAQIVTDEHNEGSIVDTMQVGYKIKDRLLRPAIVRVSKKG